MKGPEIVQLQRPVSTLVTDLDSVRDLKDLPPPLILPPSSTGQVSVYFRRFMSSLNHKKLDKNGSLIPGYKKYLLGKVVDQY